jgi:trehalose-6-phosphatase
MKVIFLDFDGVLNKFTDAESLLYLSKECVENLNSLIERSKAKIIISSGWRTLHPIVELKQILINVGFKYPRCVIGITPDLIRKPRETSRGEEIGKWLKETKHDVDSFVIIDDEDDMEPFMNRLVQTNCDFGLTKDHVERALCIISRGE